MFVVPAEGKGLEPSGVTLAPLSRRICVPRATFLIVAQIVA